MKSTEPHTGQPIKVAGASVETAQAGMILLHGRGATADDILTIVPQLDHPEFLFAAPQAANNTWYPLSFLTPIAQNEPHLSSALAVVGELVGELEKKGIPTERLIILGFSQGACLASEYVARNARRYGGVAALSGGLIGPDGTSRDYKGSLAGTPVFLGCSDVDFHIPKERVLETTRVLNELGGEVTTRLYRDMGHLVNEDEINNVKIMMDSLVASKR